MEFPSFFISVFFYLDIAMSKIYNGIVCLVLMSCALFFSGCEEQQDSDSITLAPDTKESYTFYANETGGNVIGFTSSGEWTAYVNYDAESSEMNAAGEWVTLSEYNGSAGECSFSLYVDVNETGKEREAAVTIQSGMASVSIPVVQKAEEGQGDSPNLSPVTYDRKAPFVELAGDSSLITLPASDVWPVEIAVRTNLMEPQVRLVRPDNDCYNMGVVSDFSAPDEDWLCRLSLEITTNASDSVINGELQFYDKNDKFVKSFKVVQEAGAVSRIVEVKSDVSKLTFVVESSEKTGMIMYGLSDRRLETDEDIENFIKSNSEEKMLDAGNKTYELTFDGLEPATTYYLYLQSMIDGSIGDWHVLEREATTSALESKHDLVLEVVANPANGFTVVLPFSGVVDGTIDWGDGTVEKADSFSTQHKYDVTSATTFEVRFSGKLTMLSLPHYSASATESTLTAVKQWGYTGLTYIDLSGYTSLAEIAPDTEGAFSQMEHFGKEPYAGSFSETGISSIPEGFFDYAVNATSFDSTFGDCANLTEIPAGLFKNNNKAKSFNRTFSGCKNLKEIHGDIFAGCTEVESFELTFYDCEALESVPGELFADCRSVTSFEGTFNSCSSLRTLPSDLFANCPNVLYFGMCRARDSSYRGGLGVFDGCTSLESIPEDLFAANRAVKDFSYAFNGCKALREIPQGLFAEAHVTIGECMFSYCTSLTGIPASLFDASRQLTNVREMFAGCVNLTGESPYTLVDGVKVHLYERGDYPMEFVEINQYSGCFNGCTGLSDYDAINAVW